MADKQGSWQREGQRKFAQPRGLVRIEGIELASEVAQSENEKYGE
jgi:hypothetical protein